MIKMENLQTFGFMGALRGMRNPMNSWHLNDSKIKSDGSIDIGPNDLKLLLNLTRSGESHRKVIRMFHIQMDITAPLYWWKDYDTYKVSTVANSCSTMHKIHAKEFELSDFSHDQLGDAGKNMLFLTIDYLNAYRQIFIDSGMKDKDAWYAMIQMLPTSYMQKRTVDFSYETALRLISDRKNHKLKEFRDLCDYLLKELPYMQSIYNASIGK